MKTKLLIISAILISFVANAAIWRVSKDATYLPHFTEIQAAIDSANAGDSIYVYPGSYDNITLAKQLTIIGSGYFHVENKKDSLTSFTSEINIDQIYLKKGSDNSNIIGLGMLNVDYSPCTSTMFGMDSTSNVLIEGNKLTAVSISNCNMINLSRNFITGRIPPNWNCHYCLASTDSKNLILSNNIIGYWVHFDANSTAYLKNNYIGGDIALTNCTLENNILMGQNFSIPTCWEQYNIFKTGCNLTTISANSKFATFDEVYPTSPTADNYQLSANSAAKSKGQGGADCGPFGGLQPYCLSGVIVLPTIVNLFSEPQVSNDTGLKVRLKVKANKP